MNWTSPACLNIEWKVFAHLILVIASYKLGSDLNQVLDPSSLPSMSIVFIRNNRGRSSPRSNSRIALLSLITTSRKVP
ncbi:hypothetical protein TorRG33x02_108670 [Trema orientale]|uniref:Uncharacterized protein n=1 Tax=Trema orientale TaxID=63057 RepID=A0A2P5F6A2_TREOI|nr:hypothetical protein TorRG33x02_108670 [Trema orientale]